MNEEVQNTNLGSDVQVDDIPEQENQEQQDQQPDEQKSETQKGQEEQPEKEDKKDDEKEDKQVDENFGRPENYDFKDVKLPENMQLDEGMTKEFSEYASKLNLSQKSANDMMAMAVKLTEQTQKQTVEAIEQLQQQKIEGYKVLLNRDKEIGGAKLNESIATANVAYDAFFKDEDLRVMLAESGLTVHPKFIKALKAIGSQMQDDKVHSTGSQPAESRSREDILYSSMDDKK